MGITSPGLVEIFKRENFVTRDDLQQDKRAALLAVARMFGDYNVPYVIFGGLAVQLYNVEEVRPTVDLDLVSLRDAFRILKDARTWANYGFELVFDRRRFIRLKHVSSNVEVDVKVDTRFASILEEPRIETIDDQPIPFCQPAKLALTKLRVLPVGVRNRLAFGAGYADGRVLNCSRSV